MAAISPKLKKLFVYRGSFGLTNDDLRDLAEMVLRRDVTSLSDLDDEQISRMLDGFEIATLVLHLLLERGIVAGQDSGDDVRADQ